MNIMSTLYTTAVQESTKIVWSRLWSNETRLAIILGAVAVVAVFAGRQLSAFFTILASIGTAWATWHIYNFVTQTQGLLIPGERSPSSLWDFWFGNNAGRGLLVLVVSAVLGLIAYSQSGKRSKKENESVPKWARYVAFVGVFLASSLLYTLWVYWRS